MSVNRRSKRKKLNKKGVHELRLLTKRLRAYLRIYPKNCKPAVVVCDQELKALANAFAGKRASDVLLQLLQTLYSGPEEDLQAISIALLDTFDQGAIAESFDYVSSLERVLVLWPKEPLPRKGFKRGMAKVYRKAKFSGKQVITKSSGEDAERLHHWRKQAKRWLFCCSDLPAVAPGKKYQNDLTRLTQKLGRYNDLQELETTLESLTLPVSAGVVQNRVLTEIQARKIKLERQFSKNYETLFSVKTRNLNDLTKY